MPRSASSPPSELSHRWHLAEWARVKGLSQADAQREIGWAKSSASNLFNNHQRYTQHLVDQAAAWLGIEPYELLMEPEKAMALRRLEESARTIVNAPAFAEAADRGRAYDDGSARPRR